MEVELKLQVVDQADRLGGSALLPGKGQAVRQRCEARAGASAALSRAALGWAQSAIVPSPSSQKPGEGWQTRGC